MLGYRKYSIVIGGVLIATGLLIWGKITSAEFVQLVTWIIGLYFGANVGAKVADKVVTPKQVEVKLTNDPSY